MSRDFAKPAKTFEEQVQLLQSRGMIVNDLQEARFYLQHLNYYRLGAYWLDFQLDHTTHQFKPDTNFKDVLKLYIFDRELRLLVLDGIERIEVSVRSQWAYYLAHHHSPHAHLDATLFDPKYWRMNLNDLTKEVNRSKEIFIQHLTTNYNEALPPVWAVCEVMSLGLLSRWYDSLKPVQTRRVISRVYGINEDVLESWLRHLSVVRNLCAHHSRLWNRQFGITIKSPPRKGNEIASQLVLRSRNLYNTLVIVLYFMDTIAPNHHLRLRLLKLLFEQPERLSAMGFPVDWQQMGIWHDIV
jgi:abortive infection bacteriophage resistance protein